MDIETTAMSPLCLLRYDTLICLNYKHKEYFYYSVIFSAKVNQRSPERSKSSLISAKRIAHC